MLRTGPRAERVLAVCLAIAGLLAVAWLALKPGNWGDWQNEAVPAVDALLGGHVIRFLQLAPAYGGSLIMRAPFLLATQLWHGHADAVYRAGAAPCLAAAGLLGLALAGRMRGRGSSRLAAAMALLLCVANPLILPALVVGHPEEILGAALCTGAVLCALAGRPGWAGVLLGLAVANKQWAVLATGPVLVALPGRRLRALATSGVVAGAIMAPLLLVGGITGPATAVGLTSGTLFQPWQIWWWLGAPGGGHGYRLAPLWLGSLGHTLPVAVMPPLTALYAWRRRSPARVRRQDALLLLALLMGLRCILDPWDISYYCLPFLMALLASETLTFTRPPLVTGAATFLAWFIFRATGPTGYDLSPDLEALVFTLVSVPSLVGLAGAVYAPGLVSLTARRAAWLRPPPGAEAAA